MFQIFILTNDGNIFTRGCISYNGNMCYKNLTLVDSKVDDIAVSNSYLIILKNSMITIVNFKNMYTCDDNTNIYFKFNYENTYIKLECKIIEVDTTTNLYCQGGNLYFISNRGLIVSTDVKYLFENDVWETKCIEKDIDNSYIVTRDGLYFKRSGKSYFKPSFDKNISNSLDSQSNDGLQNKNLHKEKDYLNNYAIILERNIEQVLDSFTTLYYETDTIECEWPNMNVLKGYTTVEIIDNYINVNRDNKLIMKVSL
jgi:hypothetical protein